MERIDIREQFIKSFLESDGIKLKEYGLSKNPNYTEWLENRIIKDGDDQTRPLVTDKELIIGSDIVNLLNNKFHFSLMSVDAFDIKESINEYLISRFTEAKERE